MHPELKEHSYLAGEEDDHRMKSHQGYGKNKNDLDVLHPAQAKGYGEIEMRARMMNNMRGPEEPHTMRDVVGPVAAEIKKNVAGDQCPPVEGHSPR
jgi:hypothetical protein